MPRASFRVFRTGVIGSIILGLAAGGHLAGGGQLPQPAILAALCAITIIPVAALTRFCLSLPVLAGLLGIGQLWLHWAFSALSLGASATAHPALLTVHAGHPGLSPAPAAFGTLLPVDAAPAGLMLAAHSVATLGTALLLARGEQALGFLASWLQPLLLQPERVAVLPAAVASPCPEPALLPATHPGLRLPSRRGPPAFAAA